MSNIVEFVDGDMTEEDRKKIDELLIKIAEENELPEKIKKLEAENKQLRKALEEIADVCSWRKYNDVWYIGDIPLYKVAFNALEGGKK